MFNTYAFGKQGHSTLSHKTDNKLGIYDPWGLFQVSNYGINRQTVLVNNSNSGRILQCFYIRPTLWPMHLYARSLNCWNLDSGLSFRLNFSSLVSFRRTSENDFTDFLRAGRHWRQSQIRPGLQSPKSTKWNYSTLSLVPIQTGDICHGRHCRKSWTCSTRSIMSKTGDFCRQNVDRMSNVLSTLSPVCTGP